MRVTNRASTRNYLKYVNKALSDQEGIKERIASGNRFERISDDVSSGVQAMKAKTQMYKTEKQLSNIESIYDQLTSAEDSMTVINEQLSNIHEKLLKAINDPSTSSRNVLAQGIKAMKEEILQMANSSYNGQYLFSGSNNYGAPFSVNSETGKITYNGIGVPADEIMRRDDGTYYYKSPVREADGTIRTQVKDPLEPASNENGTNGRPTEKPYTDAVAGITFTSTYDLADPLNQLNPVPAAANGTDPYVDTVNNKVYVPVTDPNNPDDTIYYEAKPATEIVYQYKDVPLNNEIYLDVGLGIRMTGSNVDPQTAFNISYAGPDVLGFGIDEETGFSNNLYNLLDDIEKVVSEEPFSTDDARALGDHLLTRMDAFRENITDVGSKTQFLETMKDRLEKEVDNLEISIGRYTGTDYIEESTHQTTADTVLKALYQLGSNIIPLSLMDFIS
jgi:flagellin-like hook-associated protein FlgL